ncbi:MAG: hypothetical protein HOL04_04640 [Gammaproteobacteria bacterium]|mgnify:FL=1|jgi:hypothetical protein|nr:hypothetical protein [Gammaproteobacteria bacterium]MBT4608282.1 hypothetical protein [Thiotrichales bacterium]MBT3473076.1 hypothetical protein [Gammaproteobacteria bacterium]MBT3967133.1 hypothetical protein [Gammaproteobacteria bacterium]MBT4079844.1 hypothetical protein [Gammaproteobacteria bacterium]
MKRALLPLLLISPLAMAQPQIEAPMPPAMMSIQPPEIPKAKSLKEELNRTPAVPSTNRNRAGYSMGTQGGRAYLEPRQDDLHPDMMTPQWELFNWKNSDSQR